MKYSQMRELIDELSLALEVASVCNKTRCKTFNGEECRAWGVPSPFQDKINELIKKSGRITQEERNALKSPDIPA